MKECRYGDGCNNQLYMGKGISMKWFLVALLMAASPAVTVYSGTFMDDFSDGNLDGWDVPILPRIPRFRQN